MRSVSSFSRAYKSGPRSWLTIAPWAPETSSGHLRRGARRRRPSVARARPAAAVVWYHHRTRARAGETRYQSRFVRPPLIAVITPRDVVIYLFCGRNDARPGVLSSRGQPHDVSSERKIHFRRPVRFSPTRRRAQVDRPQSSIWMPSPTTVAVLAKSVVFGIPQTVRTSFAVPPAAALRRRLDMAAVSFSVGPKSDGGRVDVAKKCAAHSAIDKHVKVRPPGATVASRPVLVSSSFLFLFVLLLLLTTRPT